MRSWRRICCVLHQHLRRSASIEPEHVGVGLEPGQPLAVRQFGLLGSERTSSRDVVIRALDQRGACLAVQITNDDCGGVGLQRHQRKSRAGGLGHAPYLRACSVWIRVANMIQLLRCILPFDQDRPGPVAHRCASPVFGSMRLTADAAPCDPYLCSTACLYAACAAFRYALIALSCLLRGRASRANFCGGVIS
jgi:hypothetical protein